MRKFYFFTFLLLYSFTYCQQSEFNLDAYKSFLNSHQNMEADELLSSYSAGTFEPKVNLNLNSALYLDTISVKYTLTDYEKTLLGKNGFVVTERLNKINFKEALEDVYKKDLPVFLSTDAILNAFHLSYDRILKSVEIGFLIDKLTSFLNNLENNLSLLHSKYSSNDSLVQALKDLDIYLTVPRKLLDSTSSPYYPENSQKITEILNSIASENGNVPAELFSNHCVVMDWSQFKPRGHYTDEIHQHILAKYFRAMMWLGRIQIILLDSKSIPLECPPQDFYDLKRQTILTFLISELIDIANAKSDFQQIEDVLQFFVGKQDNVNLDNINYLKEKLNISSVGQLVDSLKLVEFQDSLKNQSFAYQMILSQILFSGDVTEPDSIVPASAFMLFGQRFVIDSYVTASVVFDKIRYNGLKICRLFPSVLDPLFAMGNDAAAQLLQGELNEYHYSTNLSALRYLIDSYKDDFWNETLYNMWLNTIRTLNAPEERKNLPQFMQTGAYWQEKINTQLASWTELRHDNLLYAKQSYTGGVICSYPYSYVEPFPEFYRQFKVLSQTAKNKFQDLNFSDQYLKERINSYFSNLYSVSDTLMEISEKELNGTPFTAIEKNFLKRMIRTGSGGCAPSLWGWYIDLMFMDYEYNDKNYNVAADIHTVPTDCDGIPYGWVMHVGTGPVNLAVVAAELPGNQLTAFIGPVSSFYQYTTTNFLRLTDEEWNDQYLQSAARPDFVNLYLADMNGESRGSGLSLFTSIKDPENKIIPDNKLLIRNFPNPFNPNTIISYSIPYSLSNKKAKLTVYDIKGAVIKELVNEILPAGNYLTRWNGKDSQGNAVSSGVYIYNLRVENQSVSGKMILLK